MTDNTNNPLVSIIVRTKDRPKLLRRALQSIAAQTYRPIEVVLVNDGGCDLDIEELKAILSDVSLNYIRLEKNTGRAHAGNVGIENARGEYIGFLDDDDLLYRDHISTIMGFLKESEYGVAYTDTYIVKNVPTKEGYKPVSRYVAFKIDFDKDRLLFQNYIPLLSLLIKRDLLIKESFDPEFDLFEDWDLLIRLSNHTMFYRIPETTSEYHLRDDNMVLNMHPNTFPHIEARYRVYRKHMNLIRERAFWIFESLHADAERYKYLFKEKERELEKIRAYVNTKEEELRSARSYINQIEESIAGERDFIKEVENKYGFYIKRGTGLVSIVILTYNSEKYIKNLLDVIFYQEIENPIEVIVIDSSSLDATADIIRLYSGRYNVRLHTIDKSSFSHPKTRNLGSSLSNGKYIVHMTQDAIPANKLWLKELIRPFELHSAIAATYSRQVPRPDCNPIEARDIYIGAPCIDELRYADLKIDFQRVDYLSNMHRYIRFSDVSACYRSDLLKDNPFDERLKMVEDQEWSKRMIEKGYFIYYASKSIVIHSHNFAIKETYNRFFDYGSSFKKFLSDNPPRRMSFCKATVYDSAKDALYILNDNRRWRSKLKWMCMSPLIRFAANYGLYRGWRDG
ncbi:MAG: glycosyltransferase family 2 protein [Thermodesulfovibrionales bacterium]